LLKSSLTDKAHQQIKEWILRYHLKPGARLHVSDLAHALHMSQTPVREALSMLEKERLIEREPQKGCRVGALSMQEIEDLYDLRIALEVLAVRQAAKRMSAAARKRLSAILVEFERFLKSDRKQHILQRGQDFHVVILEASGNTSLAEIGRAILDRIWVIQNINLLTTDHLSEAHPQHLKILEALERGDAKKAAILMEKHLTQAKAYVLSRLKDDEDILSRMMQAPPMERRRAHNQRREGRNAPRNNNPKT
jgi:DNA-binding GntR family transcriptional regulator